MRRIRKLKLHAVLGIRNSRKLVDGRKIKDLYKGGQQIYLTDLAACSVLTLRRPQRGRCAFPVSVAHYYFKQDNGKRVKRYVISTKQLKPSTLVWWGGNGDLKKTVI